MPDLETEIISGSIGFMTFGGGGVGVGAGGGRLGITGGGGGGGGTGRIMILNFSVTTCAGVKFSVMVQ